MPHSSSTQRTRTSAPTIASFGLWRLTLCSAATSSLSVGESMCSVARRSIAIARLPATSARSLRLMRDCDGVDLWGECDDRDIPMRLIAHGLVFLIGWGRAAYGATLE